MFGRQRDSLPLNRTVAVLFGLAGVGVELFVRARTWHDIGDSMAVLGFMSVLEPWLRSRGKKRAS